MIDGHLLLVGQHIGDDVFAEVVGRALGVLVLLEIVFELIPTENVDAHGGQIALGLFGLLLELVDAAVLPAVHDAEAGGLLHGYLQHGDGAVGPGLLMLGYHLGIVHFIDMVAREHEDVLGIIPFDEGDILVDGVGRALIPVASLALLIGRQDMYPAVHAVQVPGLTRAHVVVELQGLILGQDPDGVDARIDTIGQGKVDDPILAAVGHGGLGHFMGQNTQPASLAACEQHGHALCLPHGNTLLTYSGYRRQKGGEGRSCRPVGRIFYVERDGVFTDAALWHTGMRRTRSVLGGILGRPSPLAGGRLIGGGKLSRLGRGFQTLPAPLGGFYGLWGPLLGGSL